MKTLIIYDSKYGCTRDCVLHLQKLLHDDVTVCSVRDKLPSLNHFDTVLIGGSVYMGAIQKRITRFCKKNLKTLLGKKVGLFIGCYTPVDTSGYIYGFFPNELLSHAVCKSIFGGEMRYETMNVIYKKLFQSLQKIEGFRAGFKEPHIEYEEIEHFAKVIEAI